MSEKEQQFERIYKETENFGRTQFVREIQMQINDNKKKDKEIERLNGALQTHEILLKSNVLEIERLNNIIKGLDNTIENLEEVIEHKDSIINKAIKYLEEHTDKLKTTYIPKIDFNYKDLLNTLKGSNNNE